MPRLLFEKTGNAIWISHLDLMRMFQRAFKRAGLPLTHTHGFNPRPSVSIALPLSVGVESRCELLDFQLDGETAACEEIARRLNETLVSGVRVLDVYETGKKIKELAFLKCNVCLEYDGGVPAGAREALERLFAQESLVVSKKNKNGVTDQDIIPMIQNMKLEEDDCRIQIEAVICCQNPTLNPMQMVAAIEKYMPEYAPSFAKCRRMEIFDRQNEIFR